ncbi:OSBP(oxysterol binding protein)-related protein 1D [Artemisia annua]|uniref:OSBP(Oxysterol binding protein)-related protein 1D n=1 Tax=Artemisia annua TaxID=35608 RepID=A0A2U1NYA0_ARTAN|nr:OSBP(oxysterol binding protein)-related protein 1D [Artemisia annua]
MNPLCCIAPVSIDKDRNDSPSAVTVKPQNECELGLGLGFENSNGRSNNVRPVSFSAQVSSVGTEFENAVNEVEECGEDCSVSKSVFCSGGGVVAGILYKWVNYGKGWRSRWFTLEDGVLSYYKTHGPDKIVLSPVREKGFFKVIGEESVRYMRKCSSGSGHNRFGVKQWKPFGEIHLKVSSVRASKSDDKRLSIFSGTKTLHLRCISREDRAAWIESLLAAKDKFPRLSAGDLAPSEDMVISTEKLRSRLSLEGISEEAIKDCESIMLGELAALQNQMKTLHLKHMVLLDKLRQLEVSSVRASKSDDKRLSIFSGTKTLHLRCISREDRAAWIESLLAAKDKFPRLSAGDLAPSEDMVISTEKLRSRLSLEGISEEAIKDCESIMLGELAALQNQMKTLHLKHMVLLDKLRQLETEKIELETTVVDETKERDSSCGQDRRFSDFYSIMSEGSGSDSDVDVESRYGVDIESDEETGTFFDTNEFMSADVLRCASYRSRENGSSSLANEKDSFLSGRRAGTEINLIQYPHVKRRDSLPEPKEKEKPVGLWSIIKDNIGKDLSGVCLPVYFNEPLSSLQKCFEDLEYSCLVDRALEWGKQGNDLMRILSIAAFAVSGYASTEGRQCKPFNPLLGETYEAEYPDKGLRFFSEKVSHHPMIVACHCEGRGWKFWADSNLKGKFWGRSIQLDPVGVLTLQFEDGETFQWSKVTTSIYNIILGKIYCDHYGTMRIKGSGNYSCKLKFKEQSIIDRNPHQVHGFVHDNRTGEKVAMLMGKWDEAMYYVLGDPTTKPKGYDPMTEAVLLWERDKSATKTRYNLTPFAISLNEITPGLREKLPPTDSRLRPDQRHLENGEYELANAEKLRLEQLQRQKTARTRMETKVVPKGRRWLFPLRGWILGNPRQERLEWNSRYIWAECRDAS